MVPKQVSPLVGFNNNVKHRGKIFHVQTEDSGVNRPRIVTHLFADGGRIIKSTKTDYSEHVGRKDMAVIVRRLMKEQHKAMFIALRDGQFDLAIEGLCGLLPKDVEDDSRPVNDVPEGPARAASPPRASPGPPTLPDMPAPGAPRVSLEEEHGPEADKESFGQPIPRRPAPTLSDVSLADLGAPPEHRTASKPSNVVVTEVEDKDRPAPKGTPVLGTPAVPGTHAGGSHRRYAAPRPAAIFSEAPPGDGASLFGGSSISEQSLDEVILSYLAEDLDTDS